MRFYKHDVERLTHLLASPRASSVTMGLSELDGYLTAVFLCPEFIPP
ncbi:MAG: YecA family protein, partial [Marivivens sp.]|nr:YecA family protein [Marivivens sp.]